MVAPLAKENTLPFQFHRLTVTPTRSDTCRITRVVSLLVGVIAASGNSTSGISRRHQASFYIIQTTSSGSSPRPFALRKSMH